MRAELEAEGATFATETDTETIVQLCNRALREGRSPVEAARATLAQLKGAFALCFLFEGEDDLLVAARRGSPLAVGFGDGEVYVGSDALALAPLTSRIAYLEEGDHAVLTRETVEIFDASGAAVEREVHHVPVEHFYAERGPYKHFMAKEMHEQPTVIADALARYIAPDRLGVALPAGVDFAEVDRLVLVACGTAHYACHVAKYWFERLARLPVEIEVASEFRYREPPLGPGTLGIFVSQSGETADTLAALRYVRAQGGRIVSVVNVETSTIARESDVALPILAGPEIGVASTKAFTCQLTVLAALALAAGRQRGNLAAEEEARLVAALAAAPGLVAQALTLEPRIAEIARDLARARDVLFLGRGRDVSPGLGGRSEAEGNQLYPRRRLRVRRTEARPDRPDRRGGAGDRSGAERRAVRQDRVEHAGGDGARRQGSAAERSRGRGGGRRGCGLDAGDAGRRPVRRADRLCRSGAAARLPHGDPQGDRRRPAAQSGEIRDGGMTDAARAIAQLRAGADPARAAEMVAYHKAPREYLGLPVPAIERLVATWRGGAVADRVDLARGLWDSDIHEARIAAAKLLTQARIREDESLVWAEFVRWVPGFDAWAIADHACKVGERRIMADRSRLDVVEGWTKGPDPWVRRVALVATLPLARLTHPDAGERAARERVLGWAGSYVADRNWFIQKAVAWWLRTLSVHDPDRVRDFLDGPGRDLKAFARKDAARRIGKHEKGPCPSEA